MSFASLYLSTNQGLLDKAITMLKGFTSLIPEASAIIEAINALAEQLWQRLFS